MKITYREIMGFGAYDEDEHENREDKKNIETSDEHKKDGYNGDITVEKADNTTELLKNLQQLK